MMLLLPLSALMLFVAFLLLVFGLSMLYPDPGPVPRIHNRHVAEQAARDLATYHATPESPDRVDPWLIGHVDPRDSRIRREVLGPSPRGRVTR